MNAEPSDVPVAMSRKRLHDLRAPLITMRGFGDELAEAVARLTALVEGNQQQLPADFLALTQEVLDRDVHPCIGHLMSSVGKLDDVLDEIASDVATDCPK